MLRSRLSDRRNSVPASLPPISMFIRKAGSPALDRALFNGQVTARFRMEIVEKLIGTGAERSDIERDLAARQHHFFPMKIRALKFGRGGALIAHHDFQFLAGGRGDLGGLKLMVLDRNGDRVIIRPGGRGEGAKAPEGTDNGRNREPPWHKSVRVHASIANAIDNHSQQL